MKGAAQRTGLARGTWRWCVGRRGAGIVNWVASTMEATALSIAVSVGSMLGAGSPVFADQIPGTAYGGKWAYFETDMDPVTVHFAPEGFTVEETKMSPVYDTGVVPRAYIFAAHPYELPDF